MNKNAKPDNMSEQTYQELLHHYSKITNNFIYTRSEKRMGLMSLNLPADLIEEMCREKEIDRELILEREKESRLKELRELKKFNKERLKELKMGQTQIQPTSFSSIEETITKIE